MGVELIVDGSATLKYVSDYPYSPPRTLLTVQLFDAYKQKQTVNEMKGAFELVVGIVSLWAGSRGQTIFRSKRVQAKERAQNHPTNILRITARR